MTARQTFGASVWRALAWIVLLSWLLAAPLGAAPPTPPPPPAAPVAKKDDLATSLRALGSALKDLSKSGKALGAAVAGKTPPTAASAAPAASSVAAAKPADKPAPGPAPVAVAASTVTTKPVSAPGAELLAGVAALPLDLDPVEALSSLRGDGSAAILQGSVRALAGDKAQARLATDLAAFAPPEATRDADVIAGLMVDAAAARDAKARALFNAEAAWQEAVMAAAYDNENAAREALEQVQAYVHAAKAAQVSLLATSKKAGLAAEQAAGHDPKKLRAVARADYARDLAQTQAALRPDAPGLASGKGVFKLVVATVPNDVQRSGPTRSLGDVRTVKVTGDGVQVKVLIESPEFHDAATRHKAPAWWESLEWTVPTVLAPGQPASFRLNGAASAGFFSTGGLRLDVGGSAYAPAYSATLAGVWVNRSLAGDRRPTYAEDRFELVLPEIQDAKPVRGGRQVWIPARDPKALMIASLNAANASTPSPQQMPVAPLLLIPYVASALASPLVDPEFTVHVWLGASGAYAAQYRYRWVADAERSTAAAGPIEFDAAPAFAFKVDQDQLADTQFRQANIAIIQANLARDQQELARETDPKRRAALQWRLLNAQSDLQAEKDLMESARTGEVVRTRTPFDDFAHDRFVQAIRDNQVRLETFQRAQVAIPRLIAMLPADEQASARDFAQRQMSADYLARMDPDKARQVAEALSNKVQGYWQGESARHEEKAAEYSDYIQRAQTVKLIANVTTLVGGVGLPSPSLATQLLLSSAEGYAEGGPAGAVQEAVAYYSAPLYAAAEALKAYPVGGFYGAASAGAIGLLKSKLMQLGVAPGAQAGTAAQRLTVKEVFASAEFKQAQSRGRALVDDFERGVKELADARAAVKPMAEVRALERVVVAKAAVAHSDIHAKAFLKYKADAPLQKAFSTQIDGVHHTVEARFAELMAAQKWNPQQLRPVRNASSAGSVGMDFDIMLVEGAGTQLLKGGRPASVHEWQREATARWAEAYKQVTGRDAGHALENVTTSLHPEAYKDLAWIGLRRGPVDPAWARQAGDITRYKAAEMLQDSKLGGLDANTRLYEAARGTAKDIKTKLVTQLSKSRSVPAGAGADAIRAAETRRRQLLERWTGIQTLLDRVGVGQIDPIHADREMRQLTGGYSIPQVIDHAGILLGELGRVSR